MNTNTKKGNGILGFIIIIGFIWWASSVFSETESKDDSYRENNYNYLSYNYNESDEQLGNPYNDGSGHSAGYEWAEENNVSSCDGNSNSFIEGCEEWLSQQEEYEY